MASPTHSDWNSEYVRARKLFQVQRDNEAAEILHRLVQGKVEDPMPYVLLGRMTAEKGGFLDSHAVAQGMSLLSVARKRFQALANGDIKRLDHDHRLAFREAIVTSAYAYLRQLRLVRKYHWADCELDYPPFVVMKFLNHCVALMTMHPSDTDAKRISELLRGEQLMLDCHGHGDTVAEVQRLVSQGRTTASLDVLEPPLFTTVKVEEVNGWQTYRTKADAHLAVRFGPAGPTDADVAALSQVAQSWALPTVLGSQSEFDEEVALELQTTANFRGRLGSQGVIYNAPYVPLREVLAERGYWASFPKMPGTLLGLLQQYNALH